MRMNFRSWVLSGAVFLVAVAFTVFCGISITNMTDQRKAKRNETENEQKKPEEPSSDEEDPVIIEPTDMKPEETSSEEKPTERNDGGIPSYALALSEEQLAEIQNSFDGTVRNFYASGSREGGNRAQSCIEFDDLFLLNGIEATIFGDSQKQEASLTFILTLEYENYIPLLLDKLSELGVKATFFTNQGYAENYPDTIHRLINDGHEIGSLGASFPEGGLANFGLQDQMNDVLRFDTFMKDNFNYSMNKFFCGYDVFSMQQLIMLNRIGYKPIFYSANYLDYDHSAVIDADSFLSSMEEKAHNGVVYSFHTTNIASINIIGGLVTWLQDQGYDIALVK